MADERVVDASEIDAITALRAEFDDVKSTVLARAGRLPTGTILNTLLPVAPPGALLMAGATLQRDDYPALVQWIADNGLFAAGFFGVGNGSTTFVMMNMQGLVVVGAGTRGADVWTRGTVVGATTDSVTLALANMPNHDHDVTVAAHATHDHNIGVSAHAQHAHGGGNTGIDSNSHVHPQVSHGGHNAGVTGNVAEGGPFSVASTTNNSGGGGNTSGPNASHTHSFTTANGGPTTHTVTESTGGPTTHTVGETAKGTGTPFDVDARQPSMPLHFIIYT